MKTYHLLKFPVIYFDSLFIFSIIIKIIIRRVKDWN